MQINTDQFASQCINQFQDILANLKTLNIIVVGKSGVGKSTLINSVFRENLAKTGTGRRVTTEIRKHTKTDFPLAIYDTPGFELERSQQRDVADEILNLIVEKAASGDASERIHCIWYCINAFGSRVDDNEINWIKKFTDANEKTQVPIIVVLTQGIPKPRAAEMVKYVEKQNLNVVKVLPVLAQDMDMNGDGKSPVCAYGLDDLIAVMTDNLPKELKATLQNVQKVSLREKRKLAHAAVAAAVSASLAACIVPIPAADYALLVPIQATMLATISAVYSLEINKTFLTFFVSSTLGCTGSTAVGKTVFANLMKLIPGAGTIVGGVISGSTAGLITTALGEAYMKLMEMIYTGEMSKEDLSSEATQKEMTKLFEAELRKNKLKSLVPNPFKK